MEVISSPADSENYLYEAFLEDTDELLIKGLSAQSFTRWWSANSFRYIPLTRVIVSNLTGADYVRVNVSTDKYVSQHIIMAILESLCISVEEGELDAEECYSVAVNSAVDTALDIVNTYRESLKIRPRYCTFTQGKVEPVSTEYNYTEAELSDLLVQSRLLLDRVGLDIAAQKYVKAFTRGSETSRL